MELDLTFTRMQPVVVRVLVSVARGVLTRCVLARPWHVLNWLISGDPLRHDLLS